MEGLFILLNVPSNPQHVERRIAIASENKFFNPLQERDFKKNLRRFIKDDDCKDMTFFQSLGSPIYINSGPKF